MKDDYSDITIERQRLDNSSVADILQSYYNNTPYSSDCVSRLQYYYDKCTEVLDDITMAEIDLLWQLRRVPKGFQNMILNFVQNNYQLWQSKACKSIDIIKFGKPAIDEYNEKHRKSTDKNE